MSEPVGWEDLAILYAQRAVRAEVDYREQKEIFDAVRAAYEGVLAPGGDPVARFNAAEKAANDPRRKDAVKGAEWHRSEAIMYATLAEMARGRWVMGRGGE